MRKKNSFMKFVMSVLFIGIIAGGGFVYLSPQFEQNTPKITLKTNGFWNLKDSLNININDASGIKYYKITFIDGSKKLVLDEQISSTSETNLALKIKAPKLDMFYKGIDVKIKIEAIDNSKWNFLNGNQISKTYELKIDNKKPVANVVNNSRYIKHGGSAVVVVKVKDTNLDDAYIMFNDKIRFELIPFYKENYYVSLIAWDVNIPYDGFNRVSLIAIDKAGNKTKAKVPFYIQKLKIKKDNIKLSKKFIDDVSTNVLEQMNEDVPTEHQERFVKQNHTLRAKNIEIIKQSVMNNFDKSLIEDFKINRFKRLRGSRTAAGFAEKRSYFLDGEKIDEAWHLGIDWASVKQAPVKLSNEGKVIFNSYLGIYGNTIIIDHGMGLSSLYAHTTNQYVNIGDEISKNKKIASTGTTGAVMGDHLHFGILVQGIEVNPIEWMDRNWIRTRITDILKNAKKTIKADK
ncbi:MAG TPA: M23 family metallopeptidase [Arcobacter sp.]|nr:M23 family metallopeptidase [Arcobacter sp.]